MKCVYCFFRDYNQSKLRKLSQVTKDRHEDILKYYKNVFLKGFKQSLNKDICSDHGLINKEKFLEEMKKIPLNEIEDFFDELIEVYMEWIKGVPFKAIDKLERILQESEILDRETEINNLLFRGRWAVDNLGNETIYNIKEMFHIPFDKRYLVGNQRFSINGYPLLYLGCSIYNVCKELQCKDEDIKKIAFSYYFYNEKNPLMVYDLTNPFYQEKYIGLEKNQENNSIEITDSLFQNEIKAKDLKRDIYLLILASFCGFEKRKLYENQKNIKFYEEYIFPQILTQMLKNKKKQGIMYTSTRMKEIESSKIIESNYRNNIVLFTEYSKENVIDEILFKKFTISNPLRIDQIDEIKLETTNVIVTIKEEVYNYKDLAKGFNVLRTIEKIENEKEVYLKFRGYSEINKLEKSKQPQKNNENFKDEKEVKEEKEEKLQTGLIYSFLKYIILELEYSSKIKEGEDKDNGEKKSKFKTKYTIRTEKTKPTGKTLRASRKKRTKY
ncbi:hypothetical protein HMPREF0202_01718 [Cetobacterium somerae ATCC BAA-474]|uniref:RES domain-containing protein n=1 Tax=Cetobacterium somerae ATCC BAA-474 TaxID=1319815 RepID=U7VB08_9FUSO|nr:hypothetical protein [Cetobacterium somerae]ERT68329.1 hypothetical protein HMPREF0202_01718 [Cetobacterium somerae ATCC BAA-474]